MLSSLRRHTLSSQHSESLTQLNATTGLVIRHMAHLKMETLMAWKHQVTSQKKKKRPASGASPTTQLHR